VSGIHLRAPVFFLFFLLKIQPLKVSIDGGPEFTANWDGNQWQLPPGRHHLRVWFLYLWFLPMGTAEIVIDLHPGQAVAVDYKHPWIVFMAGTLRVVGVSAVPTAVAAPAVAAPAAIVSAVPASWQPDPSGRFEQRYWDGSAWTEHVSTGGVTTADPVA
jgi:Protein of unknown function (DUF2510)